MAITQLEATKDCRLGHSGSVYFSIWYSKLSLSSLELLDKHHRALAQKYGKISFISVVVGAAENPPPEVRERLKEATEEMQKQRRCNFVVVQTRGLAAIIARTFLAALSLMSPEKMDVFKTIEEAVAAVKALPGQDAEVKADTKLEAELRAFCELPPPT